MKKFFPDMLERPENESVILSLVYWIAAFFLLPSLLIFMFLAGREPEYEVWVILAYHAINFVVAIVAYRLHLIDSFLHVQINAKSIFTTAAICAIIICGLRFTFNNLLRLLGDEFLYSVAVCTMPIAEASFLVFPYGLLVSQPIPAFICLALLTPVSTCCLLYGCVFAPICVKKPWLAYVVTGLMSLVQNIMIFICFSNLEEQMTLFWLQLPIHMVACWSYQKTNTIWTPIAVHIFANTLLCIYTLFFFV